MNIAMLRENNPWLNRVDPSEVEHWPGQEVIAVVDVELVQMLHHGPELNHRPYLHLQGVLRQFRPVDEESSLPFGAQTLEFRGKSGPSVDVFYGFDREQLAQLVGKGYFSHGFEIPARMQGVPWEIPGVADISVVPPRTPDEIPLVFGGLRSRNDLEMDRDSGYVLADFFPDHGPERESEASTESERSQQLSQVRDIDDLFAGEDLKAEARARMAAATSSYDEGPRGSAQLDDARTPSGVFETLMARFEEEAAAKDGDLLQDLDAAALMEAGASSQPEGEAHSEERVAQAEPELDSEGWSRPAADFSFADTSEADEAKAEEAARQRRERLRAAARSQQEPGAGAETDSPEVQPGG